jgi:hypothetical protein
MHSAGLGPGPTDPAPRAGEACVPDRPIDHRPAQLALVRATLRHAFAHTRYYRDALADLDLGIESIEGLRRFPLLTRDTLMAKGIDLLAEGVVPEYLGITSGTTFGAESVEPLLHFQTEEEHGAWVSLHEHVAQESRGIRPLMLRLRDVDHGVEIAGTFPGCFSLPLEKPYHFELVTSVLGREWSFPGFTGRVQSLSGPLNILKLLTLLCIERGIDAADFDVRLLTSSGWQMTSRWRGLLLGYWRHAMLDDVYGLSEAPGMSALKCAHCSHYHFSPLVVVETLGVDSDEPVDFGLARLVVTCLVPLAQSQPIIRYDTNDLIDIVGVCSTTGQIGFDYVGRRSKVVLLKEDGRPLFILSPGMVTEVLDAVPDVGEFENARANRFGLRNTFGQAKYSLTWETVGTQLHVTLVIELRWPPLHYAKAARELREMLQQRILDQSAALANAVDRRWVHLDVRLVEPGALALGPLAHSVEWPRLTVRARVTAADEEDG